jgi:hypothetical protein
LKTSDVSIVIPFECTVPWISKQFKRNKGKRCGSRANVIGGNVLVVAVG